MLFALIFRILRDAALSGFYDAPRCIFSVLICSFKTLIWPSRLPLSISAWFMLISLFCQTVRPALSTSCSRLLIRFFQMLRFRFLRPARSPETMDSRLLISCSCFSVVFGFLHQKNRLTSQAFSSSRKAQDILLPFLTVCARGPTCFSSSDKNITYTDQILFLIFQLFLGNGLAALEFYDSGRLIKKLPPFLRLAA